jgi:hypothetical protein
LLRTLRHVSPLILLLTFAHVAPARAQGAPPPPPGEAPGDAAPVRTIVLTDGQRLSGQIVSEGATYRVRLTSGVEIEVPATAIERIEAGGPPAPAANDTHRVSYFASPSAMMLRQGEGFVGQRELLYTNFGYGVTDFLTLEVGTALPLWFIDTGGPTINATSGLKVGGSPIDMLHVSVAAQGVFALARFGDGAGLVNLNGTVTYGGEDAHASLNVGVPLTFDEGGQQLIVSTLSGYYRFTDVVGVVTEHWYTVSPQAQGAFLFNALGARLTPGAFSIDVGLALFSTITRDGPELGIPFPLPWLNFQWGFGS